MDILEKIIAEKKSEVERRKGLYPSRLLEESIYFNTPVVSLSKYLKRPDRLGVIAEFKRQSPSAGTINAHAKVESTSIGYMQGGASALSILTDKTFFGGMNGDLT
ncbi:MAG: indole-3-glycerol-phosphate synthase TrpC, partial [Saprospiraceae bacterium]|nr:indole-3-glycerol-phosphate synthase TrpC [Saprospiraceae bacterium]